MSRSRAASPPCHPWPGLPLSHCFPDSFAKLINTTKNNFCLALKRGQQQGCSPEGEQWAPRSPARRQERGWSIYSSSSTACPFQMHLSEGSPGTGWLLARCQAKDAAVPGQAHGANCAGGPWGARGRIWPQPSARCLHEAAPRQRPSVGEGTRGHRSGSVGTAGLTAAPFGAAHS